MNNDTTFEVAPDDPRHPDNRGGLENIINAGEDAAEARAREIGHDVGGSGNTAVQEGAAPDSLGAAGTGQSSVSGQVDASTTGLRAPDGGPIGAGAVEGSRSGATAPQVEVTDIGVVDSGVTDMSVTGDDDNRAAGDARVEGPDGQPL